VTDLTSAISLKSVITIKNSRGQPNVMAALARLLYVEKQALVLLCHVIESFKLIRSAKFCLGLVCIDGLVWQDGRSGVCFSSGCRGWLVNVLLRKLLLLMCFSGANLLSACTAITIYQEGRGVEVTYLPGFVMINTQDDGARVLIKNGGLGLSFSDRGIVFGFWREDVALVPREDGCTLIAWIESKSDADSLISFAANSGMPVHPNCFIWRR
jgi:hypothetical protein